MANYRLHLAPDDNGALLVTSPDLPEVATFGEDETAAISAGERAVEEAIAARIAAGEGVPAWRAFGGIGEAFARLDEVVALKVALYRALRERGYNRARLARELGKPRNSIDRLFDLNHVSKIEQLREAFTVLGFGVDLQVYRVEDEPQRAAPRGRRAVGGPLRIA